MTLRPVRLDAASITRIFFFATLTAFAGLAGCTFDESGLSERSSCTSDSECSGSYLCYEGFCTPDNLVTRLDVGTDIGSDAGSEVGGECTDDEAVCVDNIVERCMNGFIVTEDCDACDDPDGCNCVEGACEPRLCADGERICEDNVVLACNSDGSAFDPEVNCGEDQTCVAGECVSAECDPGDRFCVEDVLVECDEDGVPQQEVDCAESGAFCSDAAGPGCVTRACEPGELRCNDDGVPEECGPNGESFVELDPCEDDFICVDGTCSDLLCLPDSVTCSDSLTRAFCNEDGTEETLEPCDEGERCSPNPAGALCVPQACEPGTTRCDGDDTVEICLADGSGYMVDSSCEGDSICRSGTCVDTLCVPGAVRCADPVTRGICNDDGTEETRESCPDERYCEEIGTNAACRPRICEPFEEVCGDENNVTRCNDFGSGYDTIEACTEDQICVDGGCEDIVCEPDTRSCIDVSSVALCNATGTRNTISTCEDGTFCEGGVCEEAVCTPLTRFCEGDELRICDGFGSGSSLDTECEFACRAGACTGPICGDGVFTASAGEQCDDGNDVACDGCEGCQSLHYLTIGSGTTTTSDATWVPNRGDLTIEGWVRVRGDGALFGYGPLDAETDHYALTVVAGRPVFTFRTRSDSLFELIGDESITDGEWHHVAASRFDEDGGLLWVDGRHAGSAYTPIGGTTINSDGGVLWIGSSGERTAADADVDEIRFSSTVRYDNSFVPARRHARDAQTTVLWHLDEGSGGTINDEGSRHIDVTGVSWNDDDCYGSTADQIVCGDDEVATWEECDGGAACTPTCLTSSSCPAGRIAGLEGECYAVASDSSTFEDAVASCESRGLSIVTINYLAENLFLRRVVIPGTAWIWIGYNDITTEGDFEWWSGDSTVEYWNDGEPNGSRAENCVVISNLTFGAWYDLRCNATEVFVCE